jgi:hypothetical protein
MALWINCPACPRVLRPRSIDPEACWKSLKQHVKHLGNHGGCLSHTRISEAMFQHPSRATCPVCCEVFTSFKDAVVHLSSAQDQAHLAFRGIHVIVEGDDDVEMRAAIALSLAPGNGTVMQRHYTLHRAHNTTALTRASGLYAAAKSGRTDAVRTFLCDGADPNGGGEDGFTPLMTASEAGHEGVVEVLLSHGTCKINQRNHYGQTALCLAAINGRTEVVLRLLQDDGVDVECVGGGLSVAEKARSAGFTELADILASAATETQVGKILHAVMEGCASGSFDSITQRILTLSSRLGAVRRDESEEDSRLCTVCLTQPIDMVIMPCFHACLCKQCAGALSLQGTANLSQCPICRGHVMSTHVIYFP